jgi:hypothetical protein
MKMIQKGGGNGNTKKMQDNNGRPGIKERIDAKAA